jgi:hypothetical protein
MDSWIVVRPQARERRSQEKESFDIMLYTIITGIFNALTLGNRYENKKTYSCVAFGNSNVLWLVDAR